MPVGAQAVPEKSTGVATIVDVPTPSGTSTNPPAAVNCGSASRSSGDWMGAQNSSGSAAKAFDHSSRDRVAKISSSSVTSSVALWRRDRGVA